MMKVLVIRLRESLCTTSQSINKQSFMLSGTELPQKIRIYDSSISWMCKCPRKTKSSILKRHVHSHIHCSIIHNYQDIESVQMGVQWFVSSHGICTQQNPTVERRKSCNFWPHKVGGHDVKSNWIWEDNHKYDLISLICELQNSKQQSRMVTTDCGSVSGENVDQMTIEFQLGRRRTFKN